jgi:hypothetical protein
MRIAILVAIRLKEQDGGPICSVLIRLADTASDGRRVDAGTCRQELTCSGLGELGLRPAPAPGYLLQPPASQIPRLRLGHATCGSGLCCLCSTRSPNP